MFLRGSRHGDRLSLYSAGMVDGEGLLLVEDDAATREVLLLLLEAEGWRVTGAESGEAAMMLLEAGQRPAVVLCDLHLPGICGEPLAARLRKFLAPAEATLLAMTATQTSTAADGYDAVLVKPFAAAAVEAMREQVAGAGDACGTAGTEPAGDPIVDLETLEQLRRGMGEAGMRGLYAFALADAGDRMDRMDHAIAVGDAAAYVREAHALKGSCGMIGARAMARLAGDAESGELHAGSIQKVSELRVATEAVRLMLETLFPV